MQNILLSSTYEFFNLIKGMQNKVFFSLIKEKALIIIMSFVKNCEYFYCKDYRSDIYASYKNACIMDILWVINPATLMASFLVKSTSLLDMVHSSQQLIILIKMSTSNPSQKSVVLESFLKPSQRCQFCSGSFDMVWQKIQDSLTQGGTCQKW